MSEIKQLLNDMKKREELRNNEAEEIIAEMKRLDLREETETERFMSGMEEDRNAGIYNHITDGNFQQIINEQKTQIKERYNAQREELKQKLEETNKKHMEEKSNDYKQISSEIKNYHLDMVLKANEEQKKLAQIELEQKQKTQEIDDMIKQKEAEKTHLVVQNRNFMDVGANAALGEINALTLEIEKLEDEKNTIANEYKAKIEEQTKIAQESLQQKERASAFLSKIRLSEKSIDEIYGLLFDEEQASEQATTEEKEAQEATTEPEVKPESETTPEPEVKPESETTPEPEVKPEPEMTPEPEAKIDQEKTAETGEKSDAESFWDRVKKISEKYGYRDDDEIEDEEVVSEASNSATDNSKEASTKTKIYLSEDGTTMKVESKSERWTQKGFKKIKEDTEKSLDPEVLKQARAIGDEKIIAEICENENLSNKEKEEQLKKYTAVLSGEYTNADDLPFEINYYVKDLRKAEGLESEDRKTIIGNAKKIRDINKQIEKETGISDALGIVDASWITRAKWFAQDVVENIKNAKWFNKVKNLLPKGKETKQLAAAKRKEETVDKMAKFRSEMAEAAKTTTEQPKEEKTETEQEATVDQNTSEQVSEEINEGGDR